MFFLLFSCITAQKQASSAAHGDLAGAFLLEGQTEACISKAQSATKMDRRNVDAWHTLALCTMKRGANEESEKAFKRALRLTPDDAGLLLNYSYLLQNLGRTDEAIKHLEHAREDLTYTAPAKVLNNLGWAYLQADRDHDAVGVLEEAVYRQPNFCGALYNLGLAYREVGSLDSAIVTLDSVRTQCQGQFPEATLLYGVVLVEMGRVEEGASYLQLVIDEFPDSDEAAQAGAELAAVGME
jgi:Tfp pilus assembly protein PilF